ncbi:MAG: undecaprenyldiphospho-muramoylpentapeptide beta-N-acetylglucosaminyltransferase [bacterium]|nr:undecaprenyldiphospho-muramoylpentapeptide beta-N-acetylglucosaminyltransferase [bacterium]
MKVVLCGGGTGGHVYPALAIAEALHDLAPNVGVLFFGTAAGLEASAVRKAGEEFHEIPAGGIVGKNALTRVIGLTNAARGALQSYFRLRKIQPNVVVGTGGYVMAPVLLAANWLKIPTVIQEQNSYPGYATRKLAHKSRVVCLGIAGAEKHLGGARTQLTGNPLRKSLLAGALSMANAPRHSGRPRVLIVGGSLGARSLNNAVAESLSVLIEVADVTWQYGRSGIPKGLSLKDIDMHTQKGRLQAAQFYDDMHVRYASADLVVCRAGAMTLAELALYGLPAILVPFPFAAHQHQLANARSFEAAGAATVLLDSDLNGHSLFLIVQDLLTAPQRRTDMSQRMHALARPDAATDIAKLALDAANT